MRASRLLRMLLLLQNRGRMTAARLAEELEVAPRTILRDVDAMTEAGLPVVAHPGPGGGIELAFGWRSRLTGLDSEEAEALGVILAALPPQLAALGLAQAGERARAKLVESLPDGVRAQVAQAAAWFPSGGPAPPDDARVPALARAVREGAVVRLRGGAGWREVHPVALALGPEGWEVTDGRTGERLPLSHWGDLAVSARRFPA